MSAKVMPQKVQSYNAIKSGFPQPLTFRQSDILIAEKLRGFYRAPISHSDTLKYGPRFTIFFLFFLLCWVAKTQLNHSSL